MAGDAGLENVLLEFLAEPVPEGQKKPHGPALGGVVYYHPEGGKRTTILSGSAETHDDWIEQLPDMIARAMPFPAPGTYSVLVTASGKVTSGDLWRAGTFRLNEEEFEDQASTGGLGGSMNIDLRGNLKDLTDARSAQIMTSNLIDLARLNHELLQARHEEQQNREAALSAREAAIIEERERLLALMDHHDDEQIAQWLEWERTKAKMVEKAPEQALELISTVGGFITKAKEDR